MSMRVLVGGDCARCGLALVICVVAFCAARGVWIGAAHGGGMPAADDMAVVTTDAEATTADRQVNPLTGEVGPLADHPIVLPFERFYSAADSNMVAGGLLLLGELNCMSCHAAEGKSRDLVATKQAPLLGDVAYRADIAYLRQFIENPHGTKPGTTMPAVLATLSPAERANAAEALTHYLASFAKSAFALAAPDGAAASRGEALFHQTGCVACHAPRKPLTVELDEKIGPSVPLGKLEAKYSIASLAAFLRDPLAVRPAGRMPHMALSSGEADDLANYLLKNADAPAPLRYAYYEGSWTAMPNFGRLQPVQSGNATSFSLGPERRKDAFGLRFDGFINLPADGEYTFWLSSDDGSRLWIDRNTVVNHGGVHSYSTKSGAVKLIAGLHAIRVDYFEQGGDEVLTVEYSGPGIARSRIPSSVLTSTDKPAATKPKFQLDAALAAKGQELFASVGCASCHRLDAGAAVASTLAAKPLAALETTKGCLAESPSASKAQYPLSARQRLAMVAAIAALRDGKIAPLALTERVTRNMQTLGCLACHTRDGVGGVSAPRNEFFVADDKDLGDEGRLPPLLTGVGDKLQDNALAAILTQGAVARPYMKAHMPQFGAANLGTLAVDLIAVDRRRDALPTTPDKPDEARKAGHQLVGKTGLTCISCHMFNRANSTGIQAMDLALVAERLRPEWLHRYLSDPQKYRPGTRMPSAWPNGTSTRPEILSGDVSRQINAVIAYLADGRRAKAPEGIARQGYEIVVGGEAVIYRSFFAGVGTRAISVGYPEQVNLSFDANNMRLGMIWQGKFLDATPGWQDRGGGMHKPLGDNVVKLADGAPFALLAEGADKTPWPQDAGKKAGYQFRGYTLDAARRPTFRYDFGPIHVDDYPTDEAKNGRRAIVRTFTLATESTPSALYFRAAAGGKIEPQSDGSFKVDDRLTLRFELPSGKPMVRNVGGVELVAPVVFQDDLAKFTVRYEW